MIGRNLVSLVLERAISHGADFAELYFEDGHSQSIAYNRGVTDISKHHAHGVGLYLIWGTKSVYVHANDFTEPALLSLCDRAGALLQAKKAGKMGTYGFSVRSVQEPNPVRIYPGTVGLEEKIRVLEESDRAARSAGRDVVSVDGAYANGDKRVLIANSEGIWAEDRRVTTRLRLTPTVTDGRDSVGYFVEYARPLGFEVFRDGSYAGFAVDAIADMRASLKAGDAPSGFYPVIFDAGVPSGTFFHECCGHQLETNEDLLNDGVFLGKLGTKVATDKVTLVDDGTMPGMYGSSKFDDEGMLRQKNTLIEKGVLKTYLVNRMGSLRLGVPRNASGRRQDYTSPPAARMSNTYLAPGEDSLGEMIRSMPEGLYVTRMGGGFGGADFTIVAHTAFWIKNGQIDRRVKNVALIGRGDQALLQVDRVGDDLVLAQSGMFCGGQSGLCNVTTSGASVRIGQMQIGGKGGKD